MAIDIVMPQLGESVAEGTVIKWLVSRGGHVKKDQPLLEVETDKVSLEVPSPNTGSLSEILITEGQTVPVGTVIARLEGSRNSVSDNGRREMNLQPTETKEELCLESVHYSPAVKRLAREYHIDLARISGTGAGGRITQKDVLAHVNKGQIQPTPPFAPKLVISPRPEQAIARDELLPFTPMRRSIAERMVESRRTSAHVVTVFEADYSVIEKVRRRLSLTYLPFVVKAVTQALRAYPILNASWSDKGILMKHSIHIGIAVALEDGLLVPVIRDADQKTLKQLAQEIADLAYRARTKQLKPEEVQGGTFSITNHGGFGSLLGTPIIHQPNMAILGMGTVQKRPVVINDAIAIRPMGYLSLAFDHRGIDGATADKFMTKVKEGIEHTKGETTS